LRRLSRRGVEGGDGGLEGVGSGAAPPEGVFDQAQALGDLAIVPLRTVLLLQEHQLALAVEPRGAAGVPYQTLGEGIARAT
jgi:hypothetical protein